MSKFLKKLSGWFILNKIKALTAGVICVVMISGSIFTGATVFTNSLYIHDGEQVKLIHTMENDINKILSSQNISIDQDDSMIFEGFNNRVGEVYIKRAFNVFVTVDSSTKTVRIAEGTTQDVLNKADITLSQDDIVSLPLNQQVAADMQITINRVSSDMIQENTPIAFETVQRQTSDLKAGTTQVQTAGQDGNLTTVYKQNIIDGVVVSTEVVSQTVTLEPVTQVVLVGTRVDKPVVAPAGGRYSGGYISELAMPGDLQFDGNGVPIGYSKVLTGKAAAYTGAPTDCMATGKNVKPGYIAVNPKIIPYGTRMFIPGYGYCIAADTGGSCMANKIIADLFMNTEAECQKWGMRTVNIYILS